MSTLEVKAIQAPSGYDLDMPAGAVIQVVHATTHSDTSTSSSSYVATTLAATITPKFASSKILITYSGSFYSYSNVQVSSTVYRGSTDIADYGSTLGVMRSWQESSRGFFPHQGQLLDSPNTTSATTYTVYMKKNTGSYTIDFPTGAGSTFPSIVLTEVSA